MSTLSMLFQWFISVITALAAILLAVVEVSRHDYLLVGTRLREYVLHVPETLDQSAPVPLLVALHQFSDSGRKMETLSGFDAIADRENFIVAYPDGILVSWNSDFDGVTGGVKFVDDERFILTLVERLQERFNIDPNRVYLTGASNGGMMTQLMGCRHGDVFAAIAPVMGSLEKVNADACDGRHAVSVLLIHGTADPIVPYDGGAQEGPRSPFYLSAVQNAAHWAGISDCRGAPVERLVPPVEGETGEIVLKTYETCAPGVEVALCTVVGGGHTWPGGTGNYGEALVGPTSYALNASEFIWTFFEAHPRSDGGS